MWTFQLSELTGLVLINFSDQKSTREVEFFFLLAIITILYNAVWLILRSISCCTWGRNVSFFEKMDFGVSLAASHLFVCAASFMVSLQKSILHGAAVSKCGKWHDESVFKIQIDYQLLFPGIWICNCDNVCDECITQT